MASARNGDVEIVYDFDGQGPDLLLIVGAASTRALWQEVRPALAASFRTIAFDNRDSGESSTATSGYGLAEMAADAIAVLDAAGSQRAHVLGHSLGGAVAQELALTYPQRCSSLTLACTWARGDDYSRNALGLLKALTHDVSDDRTLLAAILWAGAGVSTLSQADLWDKTDAALALGPLAARAAIDRQWQAALDADLIDRLDQLQVPAHVIWCDEDKLLPQPLSQRLAEAIASAPDTRIEGCGHLPMVDAPESFLEAVLGFLSKQ